MFKYIVPFFGFPCVVMAQQNNETYYAVPYLQLENAHTINREGINDFGYNVWIHADNAFLKDGYYMWVDDQWYQIENADQLFTSYNKYKTLFTIAKENETALEIKDENGVGFLYPIEALDAYKVSYNDFVALAATVTVQNPILYEVPEVMVPEEIAAEPTPIEVPAERPVQENETEEVLITSEDPSSVLLDVMDVVEIVKREEIPFDPKSQSEDKVEEPDVPKVVTQENQVHKIEDEATEAEVVSEEIVEKPEAEVEKVEKSAADTPIIPNPSNDYEIAVNEGFDGTVTEWIEMIDAQGGKSAYEQALDKGYEGTEDEWKKMLWGRQVDVEIAKRDKTSAIVTEWIQSLKTTSGNSPYDLALKHGFYGTFTEWVESVVGTDGEKAYEHAKTKGFEGTYKEWIEQQLNQSNQEVLRKERLANTQMFVAPNVVLPLVANENPEEPLQFDLFDYYNKYYGAPVITSGETSGNTLELRATDLEYQITWFERDKVKIIALDKDGTLKYQPLEGTDAAQTTINIRYLLK